MSTPCLSEPPAPRTHQYCALIWDPSQKRVTCLKVLRTKGKGAALCPCPAPASACGECPARVALPPVAHTSHILPAQCLWPPFYSSAMPYLRAFTRLALLPGCSSQSFLSASSANVFPSLSRPWPHSRQESTPLPNMGAVLLTVLDTPEYRAPSLSPLLVFSCTAEMGKLGTVDQIWQGTCSCK